MHLRRGRQDNTPDAHGQQLKRIGQAASGITGFGIEPDQIQFCLEATGHYWLALYCQLSELGYSLHVINPIQSDALRNFYVRKTKTDQKDSLLLADLLRWAVHQRPSWLRKLF